MAAAMNIARCSIVRLKTFNLYSTINYNQFNTCLITQKCTLMTGKMNIPSKTTSIFLPSYQPIRKTSFLTTLTADQLWKGVTSVSNAGKRRGRGKGTSKRVPRDLNRGQVFGCGPINMLWPGLNSPVLRGREVVQIQELPTDPNRVENILKNRTNIRPFQTLKLNPLERGFSGTRLPGRTIGPPDPIGDEKFESFDSVVLESRMVCHMEGNFGRTRRMRVLTVTGNKNGLAGFGIGKAPDGRSAIRKSKKKAAQNLCYINRFENHTVCHDFYAEYLEVKIHVQKKPKGFGLVCHRIIKCICEQIGITDIYAKVERSTNPLFLTKAFFKGLIDQKTHQELADAIKLNVVEFREEQSNFPKLIAAPKGGQTRKREDLPKNEITDYDEIINEGRVKIPAKPTVAFYKKLPSYQIYLRKTEPFRNSNHVRTELKARYGELKSFLSIEEEKRIAEKKVKAVKEE